MDATVLRNSLINELFKALGMGNSRVLRPLISPIFHPAAQRFAQLAVHFNEDVQKLGFNEATRRILPMFTRDIRTSGLENIPRDGALLIVSNNPGTVDGLVIASHLPRNDLRIVVSGVPFIRGLDAAAQNLIYSSLNTFERMKVLSETMWHLETGGSVLIFPSGGIDPDPAVMPGALEKLETWSPSLDIILRKAPSTRVLIAMVSGVVHRGWVSNPVVRIRKGLRERQRVAEFFQMMQQVIFPRTLLLRPVVTDAEAFRPGGDESVRVEVIARAREHFKKALAEFNKPGGR